MATTDYLVFEQTGEGTTGEGWALASAASAVSSDAAIRQVALIHGENTYVAVPARSWQPRTVKVEQRASFAKDGQ